MLVLIKMKPTAKEIKVAVRTLKRIMDNPSIADQFTEEEIEELEWMASYKENNE